MVVNAGVCVGLFAGEVKRRCVKSSGVGLRVWLSIQGYLSRRRGGCAGFAGEVARRCVRLSGGGAACVVVNTGVPRSHEIVPPLRTTVGP